MICCVLAAVVGIYYFEYWISLPARTGILILLGIDFASIVGSIMNAVVILVSVSLRID
jgi:hypothetical protein